MRKLCLETLGKEESLIYANNVGEDIYFSYDNLVFIRRGVFVYDTIEHVYYKIMGIATVDTFSKICSMRVKNRNEEIFDLDMDISNNRLEVVSKNEFFYSEDDSFF